MSDLSISTYQVYAWDCTLGEDVLLYTLFVSEDGARDFVQDLRIQGYIEPYAVDTAFNKAVA